MMRDSTTSGFGAFRVEGGRLGNVGWNFSGFRCVGFRALGPHDIRLRSPTASLANHGSYTAIRLSLYLIQNPQKNTLRTNMVKFLTQRPDPRFITG